MLFQSLVALAGLLSLAEARPIPHTVRLYRRAEVDRRAKAASISYATDRTAPKDWALTHNEPYKAYHFRYLTVGCAQMHDTSFFEECCHPRIYYQTDADFAYECGLSAHITDIPAAKLDVQVKAANVQASSFRQLEIVSVSSVSSASVESIKSVHSASRASISSVSAASIESIQSQHSAHKASVSAVSAASIESIQSAHSAHKASVSSAAAAAETTTHSKPSPTPESSSSVKQTPTPKPTPTTTSQDPPKPTTTDSGSGGDQGQGGGSGGSGGDGAYTFGSAFGTPSWATWYKQAGTIGACGLQSSPISDWSKVIAQRYDLYDPANCGRMVLIKNLDNGKTVEAMVNDECMGCATEYSIDLSLGAFNEIADFATGMVNIEWGYTS